MDHQGYCNSSSGATNVCTKLKVNQQIVVEIFQYFGPTCQQTLPCQAKNSRVKRLIFLLHHPGESQAKPYIFNKNIKINLELDAETTIPPHELCILCFNKTLQSFNDKQSECGQFTDRPKGIRQHLH